MGEGLQVLGFAYREAEEGETIYTKKPLKGISFSPA
jgi:hypothetical protein